MWHLFGFNFVVRPIDTSAFIIKQDDLTLWMPMVRVSKGGKGKTLYITISIYPCGQADPTKNLTISCPDADTQFRTTLSDYGLKKFRKYILDFYRKYVIEREEQSG